MIPEKVQPIFRLHLFQFCSITPKFALRPRGKGTPAAPAPHGAGTHRQIGTCGAVTGLFSRLCFFEIRPQQDINRDSEDYGGDP